MRGWKQLRQSARISGLGLGLLIFAVGVAGGYLVRGGSPASAAPTVEEWNAANFQGDVNGDGELNISDAIFLLNFLLRDGDALPRLRTSGTALPTTGQRFCWSGVRGELQSPCPGPDEDDYGQDASFDAGYPHDFELVMADPEDSSTWITVDHAMGLMWMYRPRPRRESWRSALKSIQGDEVGGFDDWRMPNLFEMMSIINAGAVTVEDGSQPEPLGRTVYADYFFIQSNNEFWTSTSCVDDASRAFSVEFSRGLTKCPDKGEQGQIAIKLLTLGVRSID